MYESLANSLALAAQTNITLVNNAVAVDLQGLMSHLRPGARLEHHGVTFDIIAREREYGTTADAFEQLLLRGGTKHYLEHSRSTNKRRDQLTCELIGRASDGPCKAFLGTGGFWVKTLSGTVGSYRDAFAHAEIGLPTVLPLDLPFRIGAEQALLGVQFAFMEGMESGFLGLKKRMVLGALKSQGNPIVSPEAQAALERLFE